MIMFSYTCQVLVIEIGIISLSRSKTLDRICKLPTLHGHVGTCMWFVCFQSSQIWPVILENDRPFGGEVAAIWP